MENILIYRLNYLGDVILTTPITRATRQYYPNATLTFATGVHNEPVLRHNPHLDQIITVDVASLKKLSGRLAWIKLLRQYRFDCCINLTRSFSSAAYIFFANIPVRAGFSTEGRSFLQTHSVTYDRNKNEIACFADVASLVGITTHDYQPEVYFDERSAAIADKLVPHDKTCIIHAGYTHTAKMWPVESMGKVIDAVWQKGLTPVLIGGKGEFDFASQIISQCRKPPVNIVGEADLLTLAAIMKKSKLYIGVDSGPAHLAKAVGLKGIVLFGPTSPVKWGYRDNINLSCQAECSPCYPRTCKEPWCMKKITAQSVIEQLDKMLTNS